MLTDWSKVTQDCFSVTSYPNPLTRGKRDGKSTTYLSRCFPMCPHTGILKIMFN